MFLYMWPVPGLWPPKSLFFMFVSNKTLNCCSICKFLCEKERNVVYSGFPLLQPGLTSGSIKNESAWKRVVHSMLGRPFSILVEPLWRVFLSILQRERLPPTNVARVRVPALTPYVGWVCCWFSLLLREGFLRVLSFSPLLENQIPNPNSTMDQVDEEPLCGCATSKSLFNLFLIN